MPIDMNRASGKFVTNASASAGDYAAGAQAAASTWERNAKSPQAEQAYAAGVALAVQNQLRSKGLQSVTAQDYATGVANNANVYAQKVSQSQDKWQRNFTPYAQEIDRIVPGLPAKNPSASPSQNYAARGGPVADRLKALRLQGVRGGSSALPVRR